MNSLIKHAVVAAVIKSEDGTRTYIQQRPGGKEFAGKWELPGGKVEEGETFEEALERELTEELTSDVSSVEFSVDRFISAVVKVGTEGSKWIGQEYLLIFFEVKLYGSIKPEANHLWIGKHQIESFKDKLCHEDLLVLLSEGMFK